MNQQIATDGQRVLIGTNRGAAVLFDPFAQQQLGQFVMPNRGGDSFRTAIDGDYAVVANGRNGAFYLDLSNPTQILSTQLNPVGGPGGQYAGPVDIDGDTIIVGATSDATAGSFTGAAFVFDRVTGNQIAKLTANDKKAGDNFGVSVAIDGNLAVVGSPNATHPTGGNKGAVYLYNVSPSFVGDRQLDKYTASPASPSDRPNFGYNVDISGDAIVALETYGLNLGPGRAFLWSANEVPQQLEGFSAVRELGRGLGVEGNYVAIGNYALGAVYLYDVAGRLRARVDAPPQVTEFGVNLSVGGDLLVVGGFAEGEAVAYVYSLKQLVVPEPNALVLCMSLIGVAILYRPGTAALLRARSRAASIARNTKSSQPSVCSG